jgi:DNA polymerase III epsilon subunit-like protein
MAEVFLILDTETTDLHAAEIVEIAIIDRLGNVLFKSLIKPTFPISDEVIEIHGITNEAVKIRPDGLKSGVPFVRSFKERKLISQIIVQ